MTLSVNNPTLVDAIVALVPNGMSVVGVGSSMNIKTSVGNISDGLLIRVKPSDLLEHTTFGLSHYSSIASSWVGTTKLNRNNFVSVSN